MSDSLTNKELRDKITELVFEWHREVQKMPRGKTISFWKDKEVMALISDTVAKAEREARLHTLGGVLNLNNGRTFSESTDWKQEYARILAIVNKRWEDTRDELKPQQKDEE